MARWAFYDYMSDNGRNVITDWLQRDVPRSAKEDVRAAINHRIYQADVIGIRPPQFRPLHGARWKGLLEMRFTIARVCYRPLACYGPGDSEITLLLGVIKKGHLSNSDCETARERAQRVSEPGRITPHES